MKKKRPRHVIIPLKLFNFLCEEAINGLTLERNMGHPEYYNDFNRMIKEIQELRTKKRKRS